MASHTSSPQGDQARPCDAVIHRSDSGAAAASTSHSSPLIPKSPTAPPQIQHQIPSDLVRRSEIEEDVEEIEPVRLDESPSQLVVHRLSRTPRKSSVRAEKIWRREARTDSGPSEVVHLERREDKVRAVKGFRTSVKAHQKLRYTNELQAIKTPSNPQHAQEFVDFDVWFDGDDSMFISMESSALGDLQMHLRHPSPRVAARTFLQTIDGLRFMREIGVDWKLVEINTMIDTMKRDWVVKISGSPVTKRLLTGSTSVAANHASTPELDAQPYFDLLSSAESLLAAGDSDSGSFYAWDSSAYHSRRTSVSSFSLVSEAQHQEAPDERPKAFPNHPEPDFLFMLNRLLNEADLGGAEPPPVAVQELSDSEYGSPDEDASEDVDASEDEPEDSKVGRLEKTVDFMMGGRVPGLYREGLQDPLPSPVGDQAPSRKGSDREAECREPPQEMLLDSPVGGGHQIDSSPDKKTKFSSEWQVSSDRDLERGLYPVQDSSPAVTNYKDLSEVPPSNKLGDKSDIRDVFEATQPPRYGTAHTIMGFWAMLRKPNTHLSWISKKLFRPRIKEGYRRIEWICDCGSHIFSDFLVDADDRTWLDNLERTLQKTSSPRQPSPLPEQPAPVHLSLKGSSTTSTSKTLTSTAWATAPGGAGSAQQASTSASPQSSGPPSRSSSPTPRPRFLALCVETGQRRYKTVQEISMDGVRSDAACFQRMKEEYIAARGWLYYFRFLISPDHAQFVKFMLFNRRHGYVSLCDPPYNVPINEPNYEFDHAGVKRHPPPMGKEVFIHYLLDHKEGDLSDTQCVFMPRLPKRIGSKVIQGEVGDCGWGIHVVEGLNRQAFFWILVANAAAAMLVTGLWAGKKEDDEGKTGDVQGATGLGTLVLGLPSLLVTAFALHYGGG